MNSHFDRIEDYDAEIPKHMRDYFAVRKTNFILEELKRKFGRKPVVVLDAGCGTGWHCKILSEKGYHVVGIDLSENQVTQAKRNNPLSRFMIGDILSLPFNDDAFDVSYTINTLHHLASWREQRKALRELARVTKKDGLIIVHEMNTKNPIIQFYLNHIFPKLRSIDEGREHWIPSDLWNELGEFDLQKIEYYTFMPDFTPRPLLPIFQSVEAFLERTPIKSWSAHYMVVSKNLKM